MLHVQLELLHLQLLAWTSAKYERVLMHNPALDTSAALAGTEASFEALIKRMDCVMDYVLQAVETLRMRPIVRGAADAALQQVSPQYLPVGERRQHLCCVPPSSRGCVP